MREPGSFFTVPKALVDVFGARLTPGALRIAISLYFHMNERTGTCEPSFTRLERETGMHRTSVARAIRELERFGIFAIERRGQKNIYRIGDGTSSVDATSASSVDATSVGATSSVDATRVVAPTLPVLVAPGALEQDVLTRRINKTEIPPVSLYSGPFEKFWNAYGKKGVKRKAWEAWQRAIREASFVAIIEAVPIYLATDRVANRGFKQDAATWLNGRGWENPTLGEENDPKPQERRVVTRQEQILKNTIAAGDEFLQLVEAEEARNGQGALQRRNGSARPRLQPGEQRGQAVHLLATAEQRER